MNELQKVFDYSGVQIRTIVKNDEVWFVAKDICDVLEIKNVSDAVSKINDKFKTTIALTDTGSNYKTTALAVNEAGMYKLIFKSRKEEAEKFSDWVAGEVLPTIRKTGGYVMNDDIFVNTYLPFADDQTKMLFRATLDTIRKQNEQIAIMQPKAKYFDALVDRNLLTNFRDTAKELEIGPRKFIEWLLDNKFVYRDRKGDLKPYAQYVPELFKLKDFERNGKAGVQTLITPKGKESFRLLIKGEAS
ncbi:BRO family protein [Neobacillus thermocopriae]|jgi:prophage antirepressor-like protein|uniref:BRO family protein n=1 Tax=Neobacillus thermocopriae TaxID=1215031 RepID=UPI002E1CB2B3|nr:BRO family protein [Neobacillus thermocopriae]MED3714407.1 BRO family protein [Neobacillus thermocopriae]